MSISDPQLPVEPGSYLLWFYLPKQREIAIGRLGSRSFRRGWYGYCGSAFGPGGLRARLQHHLRRETRKHWHIDYFKEWAAVRGVWLCRGRNQEHHWSELMQKCPGAECPVPGFGASDCRCVTHLTYFPVRSQVRYALEQLAGSAGLLRFDFSRSRFLR